MSTLAGLTPELDAAVRAELRPGEELWYASMPAPKHMARKMWPIAIFGLFFGGFAAFWIAGAAWGVWFSGASSSGSGSGSGPPGLFVLFPLFGLPFLAIGLGMVSSPFWVARKAKRTACCVTSQRALQVQCGRSVSIQSWGPEDIDEISKTIHPDGLGSLMFVEATVRTTKGGTRTAADGFYGVVDPRACEDALLALKATSRSASGPRTTA